MSEEVKEGKLGDGYYQDSYVKRPKDKQKDIILKDSDLFCFTVMLLVL